MLINLGSLSVIAFERSSRTAETIINCTAELYACRAKAIAHPRVNIYPSTIVCSANESHFFFFGKSAFVGICINKH